MTDEMREFLIDTIDRYADFEGINVRRDYSGRGMYGDTCVGIVVPDVAAALVDIIETAREIIDAEDSDINIYEVKDEFVRKRREDSMGYERIVYWPCLQA